MGADRPHSKLGERIRTLLGDSGISQRELARRLDVGPNQVSRWILGGVAPTYTVLNDILKICRKKHQAGWLLTGNTSQDRTDEAIATLNDEDSELMQRELIEAKNEIIELLKANAILKEQLNLGKQRPLQKEKIL